MTHTKGPWVGFSDGGKTVAIMPAGRDGDICTFRLPPSEADANVMIAAPTLAEALDQIFSLVSYVNIHGVGEQPESNGLPQPVRVKPEEFWELFQRIGKLAAAALEKADPVSDKH